MARKAGLVEATGETRGQGKATLRRAARAYFLKGACRIAGERIFTYQRLASLMSLQVICEARENVGKFSQYWATKSSGLFTTDNDIATATEEYKRRSHNHIINRLSTAARAAREARREEDTARFLAVANPKYPRYRSKAPTEHDPRPTFKKRTTEIQAVTYNMQGTRPGRLQWLIQDAAKQGFHLISLQGHRIRGNGQVRLEWSQPTKAGNYRLIAWTSRGSSDHGGVALALHERTFPLSSIRERYDPPTELHGRIGAVRIKRRGARGYDAIMSTSYAFNQPTDMQKRKFW